MEAFNAQITMNVNCMLLYGHSHTKMQNITLLTANDTHFGN